MRLTSSGAYTRPTPVPKMPPGLVELMEGLARNVLRNNPADVYDFCANHMEKLLEIRDGPSLKKPLTLEQKILKAQEKVRQRAKERQERFDSETKLQSKKSDEESPPLNNADSAHEVIQIFKVLIHHEHDLEHDFEVEISHVSHAENAPLSVEGSIGDGLNAIKEVYEDSIESLVGAGTVNIVTITDNKPEYDPIFGKVEREIVKELEIIKTVNQEEAIDSQLQTITEASDENSESATKTNNTILVPVITIGDGPDNIAQEPVQEIHRNEHDEEKSVEINLIKTEVQNKSEGLFENLESNELEKTAEDDSINLQNSVPDAENIEVSVNVDHSSVPPDNEIQQNVQITETVSVPTNIILETNATEIDSDAGNITETVQQENSTDIADAPLDTIHSNLVIPSGADVGTIGNVLPDSKDEHKDTDTNENENITFINQSNEDSVTTTENNFTEIESATKTKAGVTKANEKVDMIADHKADPNILQIDVDKIEPVEKVEKFDQHLGGNDETHDNISTENLLQKSDSTENTNEDSISILESDLSKTDDDSSQNNPNNMDLETAAVTIQKVFRSFMFKSRNSTFEDAANDEHSSIDEDNDKKEEYYAAANLNKERRPLGITRMDTVLQTVNEEKSLSLSTDDSSTLSSAATTIQAHVRGFLVRNRLNSSKTYSMNSLVNSHEMLENDSEQQKNKTVLNIHIVPEEGNYLSRDESLITSMDLSLDISPPSSVNLHPLSYDISERRKMLKREDAVQSVSPPSNNSGKQSEDSVKEILINDNGILEREPTDEKIDEIEDRDGENEVSEIISSASTVTPTTIITISKSEDPLRSPREYTETALQRNGTSFTKMSSDESDVITPFVPSPRSSENPTRLLHSGEFHDVVLPTKVSRNDTSVVRGE